MRRRSRPSVRPSVQMLEVRRLLATIVVTGAGDAIDHGPDGGSLISQADDVAASSDADEADPRDTARSSEGPPPVNHAEVGVSLSGPDGPAIIGDLVTFTAGVFNEGPDAATDLTFNNITTAQLTIVSISDSPGFSTMVPGATGGSSASAFAASFPAGAVAVFKVVARIDYDTAPGTSVGISDAFSATSVDSNQDGNFQYDFFTALSPSEPPTLSIDDATIAEGDDGTTPAVFAIHLSRATAQSVTVSVSSADITATAPEDYAALPPTRVTFAPGQLVATVAVDVRGDTEDEPDETFAVTLSDATDATIARGSATGTILDDDPTPPPPPSADLGVTIAASPGSITTGGDLTFAITITNRGPDVATNARLTDFLVPAGASFASTSRGSYDVATRAVSAALGDLGPGDATTVTVVVRVDATAGASLLASAEVTSDRPDPDPSNDRGSLAVAVAVAPQPTPPVPTVLPVTPGPMVPNPPAFVAPPTNLTVVSLTRRGYHDRPTRLLLQFSTDLDPSRAGDLAFYRLIGPGVDGRLGTRDDAAIRIRSATYDASDRTLTLRPARLLPLRMRFRLSISCLEDRDGRLLDGDRDGHPGGPYVATIRRNLLRLPVKAASRTHHDRSHPGDESSDPT